MYPRSRRRAFRRRRRTVFRRRKFKRPFFKRRRGRTAPRRRKHRHGFVKRTIVCPIRHIPCPEPILGTHIQGNTDWNISDIPVEMRDLWAKMYEKVKFLKVTFKFWVEDTSEQYAVHRRTTPEVVHGPTRTAEFRYSYDPDCKGRSMDASNISVRRNSKHMVGSVLNRPWYLRMRPTFNCKNYDGVEVAYNPWFSAVDVFTNKSIIPIQRNAYLFDFLARFTAAHLVYQITLTLGFKGL